MVGGRRLRRVLERRRHGSAAGRVAAGLRRHGRRRLALDGRPDRRHQRRRLRRLRHWPALVRYRRSRRGHRLRLPRPRRCAPAHAHRGQPRQRVVPHHRARERDARLHASPATTSTTTAGWPTSRSARPMANSPSRSGGGAVYVVFGTADSGRRQHHGALPPRLHERAHQPCAALAARQPLRRLRRQRPSGHVAGSPARRQRRRLQRPRRRLTRRAAARRVWRRGGALRQAAGRAHHAQQPLGVRLPVLLPRRFPGRRGPIHRRERRERRRHDGRWPAGHRHRHPAGRLQRPHRLRLGVDHQRPPPADRRLHAGLARRRVPVDPAQPPHRRPGLSHRRCCARAINSGPRWRASAT